MSNQQWKYGLVLTAILVMLASLFAGCSKNASKGESSSTPSGTPAVSASLSPSPSAEASPTPALTPITYSMNTKDDKMTWDTPITKAITAQTGVSFKYDLIVGDENQKADLWLASGDYPDIIAFGPAELQKYKDGGALVPLNDLIDQYGPNIKEKFGKYFNMLKDKDGKIWSLYGINHSKEAPPDASANFIVQYDVLKEAGYPEIKTLDQLYDVIKSYKDKHPKIDGKETIGYTGAMQGWQVNIEYNNPIISAAGLPDHGNFRIDAGGKVQFNPMAEDAKLYYKFLNKLYVNGLYDKEAFSQDDLTKKIAQGRVLASYVPNWLLGNVETSFRKDGHPERAYAHLLIHFAADTVDNTNTVVPTFAGSQQWAVTKSAKNPEQFIKMVDYLFSDKGQILTHWGIQGTHYVVKDGHRVVTQTLLDKRKTDPDTDVKEGFTNNGTGGGYWFTVGNGSKLDDGDYATPLTKEYVKSLYDDMTKEVLAKYGKEVWADFLPPAQIVPGYLWQLSPPDSQKLQSVKLDEAWKKYMPRIIMSKSDGDFDNNWKEMVSSMQKAGTDDVNAAYTKLWADFNANFKATIGE